MKMHCRLQFLKNVGNLIQESKVEGLMTRDLNS